MRLSRPLIPPSAAAASEPAYAAPDPPHPPLFSTGVGNDMCAAAPLCPLIPPTCSCGVGTGICSALPSRPPPSAAAGQEQACAPDPPHPPRSAPAWELTRALPHSPPHPPHLQLRRGDHHSHRGGTRAAQAHAHKLQSGEGRGTGKVRPPCAGMGGMRDSIPWGGGGRSIDLNLRVSAQRLGPNDRQTSQAGRCKEGRSRGESKSESQGWGPTT